eukprot:765762-Hanusia_phi.AAC.3
MSPERILRFLWPDTSQDFEAVDSIDQLNLLILSYSIHGSFRQSTEIQSLQGAPEMANPYPYCLMHSSNVSDHDLEVESNFC